MRLHIRTREADTHLVRRSKASGRHLALFTASFQRRPNTPRARPWLPLPRSFRLPNGHGCGWALRLLAPTEVPVERRPRWTGS
jgi:hypothetical protein